MPGARDGQLRIRRGTDSPAWTIEIYDDDAARWRDLRRGIDDEEDRDMALHVRFMADDLTLQRANTFVVVQPAASGKTLTFPDPADFPGEEILVIEETGNWLADGSGPYTITLAIDQATPSIGGSGIPVRFVSSGVHWYAVDF